MENRDISVHHLTPLPGEQIASTEGTMSKLDQRSQTLNANSSQFSFIKKLASQIYSVFIHRLELVGSNPGTQLKKSLQSSNTVQMFPDKSEAGDRPQQCLCG